MSTPRHPKVPPRHPKGLKRPQGTPKGPQATQGQPKGTQVGTEIEPMGPQRDKLYIDKLPIKGLRGRYTNPISQKHIPLQRPSLQKRFPSSADPALQGKRRVKQCLPLKYSSNICCKCHPDDFLQSIFLTAFLIFFPSLL